MRTMSIILVVVLNLSMICLGYSPADFDGDGNVNLIDFGMFANQWLEKDQNEWGGYVREHEMLLWLSAVSSRRHYVPILPLYIDCFDDPNDWADLRRLILTGITEYEGEKAYLCGDRNFRSILVTKEPVTRYGRMRKGFATAKDFSGCNFELRLKVLEGVADSSWEHIRSVFLGFKDSSGKWAWFFASRSYGWQVTCKTRTDMTEGDPSIDWSEIVQLGFDFRTEPGTAPQFILDRLIVFKSVPSTRFFDKPIVINTFDDNWASHYDAAAYLSSKGMVGTFYTIGNSVGKHWRPLLTLQEYQDMHWAGHLIANHSWTHPMPFDELSFSEQIYQITKMQRWMCENGFGDGARIFTAPGNDWNPCMERALGPYVDHVRQTLGGGGMCRNPLMNPTRIRVSAGTPLDALAQVERALAPGEPPSIIVYMGHDMVDNMTDFKTYVDYLELKRNNEEIHVCTPADLLAGW